MCLLSDVKPHELKDSVVTREQPLTGWDEMIPEEARPCWRAWRRHDHELSIKRRWSGHSLSRSSVFFSPSLSFELGQSLELLTTYRDEGKAVSRTSKARQELYLWWQDRASRCWCHKALSCSRDHGWAWACYYRIILILIELKEVTDGAQKVEPFYS